MTNNNGGCCVSDNLMHEHCIITTTVDNNFTRKTLPGFEPGFELLQCKSRCSSDRFCKGFSMFSVSYNVSTILPPLNYDACILYTTSNDSSYCTHNLDESLRSSIKGDTKLAFADGSLNPNANCTAPQDTTGMMIDSNYYEGCNIRRKDVEGNTYFLYHPIQITSMKIHLV